MLACENYTTSVKKSQYIKARAKSIRGSSNLLEIYIRAQKCKLLFTLSFSEFNISENM